MRRLSLMLCACLLLSGCAVKEPDTALPDDFLTPETWQSADAAQGDVIPRWWDTFNDPQLDAFIAATLNGNYNLRATAQRILAAEAQAKAVGAELLPSVSGQFGGSRGRTNIFGIPIPGQEVISTTNSTWNLGLSVSWEADLWGRLRAGKAAALAEVAQAEASYGALRQSLAAVAARSWFAAVAAKQQLDLASRTVSSFEQSRDWIQSRYDVGLAEALDLRLARSAALNAKALVVLRELELETTLRQLQAVAAQYPDGAVPIAARFPDMIETVPAGLPAELIDRRPDVQAAKIGLAAAGYRVQEARAGLYPRLSLSASGGTSSEELEDLLDGDLRVWNIAGNLLQPIFQGGRLRANVDAQEALQRQALNSFADTALQAYLEVESALLGEDALRRQEAAIENVVEEIRATEALALRQYRAGAAPYLNVLDTQRQALSAEGDLIDIRTRRLTNRVDLHLALGGPLGDVVEMPMPMADAPQAQHTFEEEPSPEDDVE